MNGANGDQPLIKVLMGILELVAVHPCLIFFLIILILHILLFILILIFIVILPLQTIWFPLLLQLILWNNKHTHCLALSLMI